MAELSKLLELLFEEKPSNDLAQRLRSESVKPGLERFYAVLKQGLDAKEDGKLSLESWTVPQIQAICAVAYAIASATRSLSVEQAEPVIVAILQQSVEFAVSCLENESLQTDDFTLQNSIAQILEAALSVGTDREMEAPCFCSLSKLLEFLLQVDISNVKFGLSHMIERDLQEQSSCSREDEPVDRFFIKLGSECVVTRSQSFQFRTPALYQNLNRLVSLSQRWAVSHTGCIQRLILICKELVKLPGTFDEKAANTSCYRKLSFGLRIFKLLGNLAKNVPYVDYDVTLVQAVALCADALAGVFRTELEFVSGHVATENSFDSLVLTVVEEFLHVIQVVFCNSVVSQNVLASIVASILGNLDHNMWRYNKSASSIKPPLAYFPRSVMFCLKLIEDIRRQNSRDVCMEQVPSCAGADILSCSVRSEEVYLLQKHNVEELLRMIFPSSEQWVGNLFNLLVFLHTEGLKSRPKLEKSVSNSMKVNCASELDSVVCHDDEALFGDLFSEGGRSVASNDAYDAVPTTESSISSYYNMPSQVATELLSFLKACVFSPEWNPHLYRDACEKLRQEHLDILLSILKEWPCFSEEKTTDGGLPLNDHKKIKYIHELCFELLHNFITSHTLSDPFEEYLVEQILIVENGAFVYNDQALSLIAHTLICRSGSLGSQLRMKIYSKFVVYIVEKAKYLIFKDTSFKEVLETLPSLFHIEIVLMAFHLSSESEKVALSRIVFFAIKSIDAPSPGSNSKHLSCWGLLVSRLILVFRHMIFYYHARPSSLLLDLRSRLREAPLFASSHSHGANINLFTRLSASVESLLGADVREDPTISMLVNQLIDIAPFPISLGSGDLYIQHLQIDLDDLHTSFSRISGFWSGKRAASVEELIVERYIFVLCWDLPTTTSSMDHLPAPSSDAQIHDISNVEYFFHLSHLLLGHFSVIKKSASVCDHVTSVLHVLCKMHGPENIDELSWDFLRNGMWMSLLLPLLIAGCSSYCTRSTIPLPGVGWMVYTPEDSEYITFADSLIVHLFEGDQVAMLLETLGSLLSRNLLAYQRSFLLTLNYQNIDVFSPYLLLKHVAFDAMPIELLETGGSNPNQLESYYDLIAKVDATVDKMSSGTVLSKVFWECMLHGFPSLFQTSSGSLLSCILSIRAIVGILNGLLRAMVFSKGNIQVDSGVVTQVIDSVMTIKSDRIFTGLHGICEDIYHCFSRGLDGPDYSVLFPVKHMEKILKEINSLEVVDSALHEWVVMKVIDSIDVLRKDPSGAVVFKFYLGLEEGSECVRKLCGLQRGDLSILIDSLGRSFSDSANIKVLNFFVDLLSGESCIDLRQKIERKFLDMDLVSLSKWLEERLVSCAMESSGGFPSVKEELNTLRESTMKFILCLVSPPGFHSMELHNHLFEAMLVTLDTAFMQFDIHTSKSYFHFVVQFSKVESLLKPLFTRIVLLIEKLAADEHRFQGLKFLFSFLGAVLSDCGIGKNTIENSPMRSSSGDITVMRPPASNSLCSRKHPETLVLADNQEGGSASIECDAISVDEDEDDGTSDGEVASIDKDEEEDTNSDRALASKVCTFTSSGSNFMEQHWYFCYTCDLTVSKGCCSVCAKVCHRGHRVVYSRSSRFFCDCGAGGVRGSHCQCLKPRKFTGNNNAPVRSTGSFQSLLPFTESADQLPDSDSDADEDVYMDVESSFRLSISKELRDVVPVLLEEVDVEGQMLKFCSLMLPSVISKREATLSTDRRVVLGKDKVVAYSADLLQLKKAYKSGSLDLKVKADYSSAKELKTHLSSGSLFKSLLSVSIRGRLAVGEGDKVSIFDIGQLIGQATLAPVMADKTNVKPLSKNTVRFEIVHLVFNPLVENHLAVAGYEDCQVLTVNSRGEVTDRLPIELALQGAYIRRVDWVPGSQVQLMVVTNRFVKIYDLSQDSISPMHYFTLPIDFIVDATLVVASQGRLFLLVLSESGGLLKLELTGESNAGTKQLREIVRVKGKEKLARGLSMSYSPVYKILFLSYQDGTTLVGRFDSSMTSLTEISALNEDEQEAKPRPAGWHHWKELLPGSGLFSCISSLKSNAALTVSIGPHDFHAQNMRHAIGSTSPLVGITAYKPLSKDKIHILVLHDDGSLQIYSHVPVSSDIGATVASEKIKKLGSDILNNKAYAAMNPDFPLDFFERTVCITADVKLSGDAIRNGDSEGVKQNLSSEDGFLESPSPSGFKITVTNSNPDIVMVGIRVHIGNTSPSHIPSNITIFRRVIKFDEGMRSWYDLPFTVAESLLADEEFTISVGPTFSGSTMPRIDSLEVYGRAKDEFGWKEKMDTVLNMEARSPGCNSWVPGSKKKAHCVQSASVEEQVFADGLKLLSRFYSSCRSKGCSKPEEVKTELSKLKCRQLLETIFESDREPSLQAAACLVLQAVFPRKDIYYQVKDTMRLLGVVKSTSVLLSKLRVGGIMGNCVFQEFTTQIRAVTKIAFHRLMNFATFLEINGSNVVDGLMQILWEILDVEQPETQTMNNIVISSVELIYSYAECLALRSKDHGAHSVAPAVKLLKRLLLSSNESIQTSSSLAISSRLLQVPFPKQTLLATDDAVENIVSVAGPADTAVGNNQVMIEEDSITSSVQYCCDGCSTVPILRRRWHCTICPDFDLCEACYEVLDADRLPPPHSRDHPMSAIPIELESIGGDGSEIHFSSDDFSGSNLLPEATGTSVQNSTPSIHVLEPNESVDFSASMADPVLISASKRAVNSLLLLELLEHMRGWMETISGVQAIPIMQLFYRLSSAVGGPFVNISKSESLDMERLVKWFLEEINLKRPFIAKTRSSMGEVAILVFMFFTLMLRNWHQPGSDSAISKSSGSLDAHDKNVLHMPTFTPAVTQTSPDQGKHDFASQLLRACSFLRQQVFVNYLMDILQQLVQVFKSPTVTIESTHGLNPGTGCGSLLTVRRELPAGNYSPFFSDSYAKGHRSDIFMDYHRLLLENTFRLLYSLVRPEKQEKSGEKEKSYKMSSGKDLKLDGYQDVLCSYINNPHTTFVRRYARRLFLHLCGSKTHYYSVRDSWQFSCEVKKLYKHINKSGGIQNSAPYERAVKVVKCLSTMAEVAAARPRNWQKYCLRHSDILSFLLTGVFHLGEEPAFQTLKLLNLAFYTGKDMTSPVQKPESGESPTGTNRSTSESLDTKKKKKGEDGAESGLDKSSLDMEAVVDIFSEKDGDLLRQFIDCFLLEWNSSSVRTEAKSVLCGAWHHGKQTFRETLLMALLQKVKCLPIYGQNIVEYTELVTWLIGKVSDGNPKQQYAELLDRCLTPDLIQCIFETLHVQNELLANHPNSRIYNTLSGLVEFDGYYLESEPCVACSSPEMPYSRMKLESLKSETKFTDNRIIVKCSGSYTIQTVTMNVHDARKSKSVKVLNLYYNNRPVTDLSELKNNWSLWKRAKSCHLAVNQTELKVEFPIPITACNFMIELDSFYENLQALSLEPLQCPRCSRPVTDKHGICSNCHENAYQCRQCRNINYENLDSFLCNECGYSKYGRFEFNFMAKPSFTFDNMENDDDMKRGLAAIESESENAHRRYQQLLGFKKPLLKIVSSIGENEMDSQQKDSVQQMMVSLPGPSCKVNRKIALLGVLYGEKCKAAFDSVSKSVQTLQGLRRVLMNYLHQKHTDSSVSSSRCVSARLPNNCYGCATTFVTQCLEILRALSKHSNSKKQLVSAGILSELFENNIHQGPKTARVQARAVLCSFSEGDIKAVAELNSLIQKKVFYCLEHHRSMDIALATREELSLLSEVCSLADEFWESRLRVVFQLLFSSIKQGARHPAISEHIILPCLRIISQACTPPKSDAPADKGEAPGKFRQKDEINVSSASPLNPLVGGCKVSDPAGKNWNTTNSAQDIQLLSYSEWEKGATYLDFVRRQYKVCQAVRGPGQKSRPQRYDYLDLKYALRWKRRACKSAKSDLSTFELGSWVTELVLSACSQSIRAEMCILVNLLSSQSSSRRFRLLNLLMDLLPATLSAGESAAEYFDLFFKMVESEEARLFLTVRGCLSKTCKLIMQEVGNVESLERTLRIDISQGFILHKLVELLGKFLEVPNIRARFMRDNLLSEVLEAFIVIRGVIVQKTKLISDCNRLLRELLDSLLVESSDNRQQFIRACISGLKTHAEERKGRTSLFILEQLCDLICPSKPESLYLLVLNKAHTQEEFIRGSMTKNPYSSAEIGPLMRDVKNKICHQLDLIGLLEDDYGMELLVAGNIISLDLSIAQVYDQVWKKSNVQSSSALATSALLSPNAISSARDSPPMTVTYRLQGLDGEATEPMIKELDEDREECQDPEVEFAIAGAVREYGGFEIILGMIQRFWDDLRGNQEQLVPLLNLLMHCCKIRENRRALLRLGALGLLLETVRRAFSVDAVEPAEGILLIVESLTLEANESDNISIAQNDLKITSEERGAGEQARKIVLMFLERLSHPSGLKKSNKQQRNTEMVARILPYLTYGEPAAMEALVQHFNPYLQHWGELDRLLRLHLDNPKDDTISQEAAKQRFALENFIRVSESLKTSSCGGRLKDIIVENGIIDVAVRHLRESFSIAAQAGFKSSAEWALALTLPSVPLILSMLRGLSVGHLATQKCIDDGGILPLLHALEGVSGENEVGARAENLLDTLSDKEEKGDGFLVEKVQMLRHATRDEMRRRALKKREELLQGLGMRQEVASDGGERIVVSQPILEGLEDVEEEDGLACMVCREGYTLRPTDMLGVYTYSKRVNLGVGTLGGSRGEWFYTTVSHFNVIHFQCHQEAKRADAALKTPKKEWEGATLRNNETLCNSLFPVRGPSVPVAHYTRYVDQYWDNLNALGRADGSRLRLLTYDIVLMLARFATGASFSSDSKGGGRESNSRFLPLMIQMARYLLEQGNPSQCSTMAKSVVTYISSSMSDSKSFIPAIQTAVGTEETVQFMMVNSLLSESYESWLQHRRAFLQRGIYHAYMQRMHSRSTPRSSPGSSTAVKVEPVTPGRSTFETGDSETLLATVQPMLVYTGLIEQLQSFFKVRKLSNSASAKVEGTDSGDLEGWELLMKERLMNVKEMIGFSKEFLSWLEDMMSASSLQEAFDIMGVLTDVLSCGCNSCEDFVRAAIDSGKG